MGFLKKLNEFSRKLNLPFCSLELFFATCAVCALGAINIASASSVPAPVLLSPSNYAVLSKAANDSLQWEPVSGVTFYRVQVTTDSSFADKTSIAVDSTVYKTTLVIPSLPPQIYYWRIMTGVDSTDTSTWSDEWVFSTTSPPAPVLLSPPSGSSDRPSPVNLRWSANFADSSRVELAVFNGEYSFSPSDMVVDTTLPSDTLSVAGLRLAQTYYWRVMALNRNGYSSWSSVQTFSTSNPPSVSLLEPAYAARTLPSGTVCSWLQSTGVVEYELQVSKDPYYNATPLIDTTLDADSVSLPTLTSGTTYYWRVRAESNVGGYWGAWFSSVFYTYPAAAVLSSPANQSEIHAVNSIFRWKSVVGAAFYQVQVSLDSTFSSVVFDSTASSAIDSVFIDSLSADGTFFWHVRGGSNTNGWGPYSTTWSFTTASFPPPAPSLLLPHDSASVSPLEVTFSWNSVTGADEYSLELSTDSTFSRLQVSDSNITSDLLVIDSLDTATTYFWRMKSGSNTAGWGTFSSAYRFITASFILPPPTLSEPSDGSSNLPTHIVLHWEGIPHAAAYQVEVSPDSTLDTLVMNDTAVVADSVSLGPLRRSFRYFWRVRAGLGSKTWGPFSKLWTFVVEPWTQAGSVKVDTILSYPTYNDISQFKPTDYKLFGLPGNTDMPVDSLLKGTPGKDWEAFLDDGDTTNYLVRYDASGSFVFGVGNAFWLIHNGPLKIDATLNTAPLDSIGQVKVSLHTGWNIITDPYLIDVPWDTVQALNGNLAGPVWQYNGTFNTSTSLAPFQGYYYFNSDNLKSLLIPYIEPNTETSAMGHVFKVSSVDPSWTIRVTLKDDCITDSSTWFGVSALARPGFNSLDVRKPSDPAFDPSVYFDRTEWDRHFSTFASELRPAFSDSSQWTFEVDADPGKLAVLTFSGLNRLPVSFDAYLYDASSGSWTDIKQTPQYGFIPKSRTTSISVLVGRADLVKNVIENTGALTFRLDNNYPNPFNPTTGISYQLPQESLVTLIVYNVLGQKVVTLVNGERAPGEHTVEFNGSRFASGVYFYRLVAGSHSVTRKMVLLK